MSSEAQKPKPRRRYGPLPELLPGWAICWPPPSHADVEGDDVGLSARRELMGRDKVRNA